MTLVSIGKKKKGPDRSEPLNDDYAAFSTPEAAE